MSIDNTLIAPTTSAATGRFRVGRGVEITLSAGADLDGVETVAIEILNGTVAGGVYRATGELLDVDSPVLQLFGAGTYQLSKSATASAVGVFADDINTLNILP